MSIYYAMFFAEIFRDMFLIGAAAAMAAAKWKGTFQEK